MMVLTELHDADPAAEQPHGWPEKLAVKNSSTRHFWRHYALTENTVALSGSHEATYRQIPRRVGTDPQGLVIVARLRSGKFVISEVIS